MMSMYQTIRTRLADQPVLRAYALVDGALLSALPERARRLWTKMDAQSLFAGCSDDIEQVGPLLFSLADAQPYEKAIALLRDETSGQIAGSFILSSAQPTVLAATLSTLLDVRLDDGTEMVMRFFDPRILPSWLAVINPPYQAYLAEVVHYWACWQADQTHALLDMQAHTKALVERPDLPMQLSQKQEDKLMQHSYPYMMIEQFLAHDPQALNTAPVAQRYAFLDAQIQRGKGYGLDAHGDLQAYCAVALQYGANFNEDTLVSAALTRIKTDHLPFDEAIALVPNVRWQQLQKQGALP
jgi:Domain of unknown function (DUF4123)